RSPAAASMRSSRSTKRHANWRASSVPTVVLPEPMKPARQSTCGRDCGGRGGSCVINALDLTGRPKHSAWCASIALQYADCTTVRVEFDFSEAAADRAEQAFGEFRCDVPHAVRIRLQIRFCLV